MGWKMLARAIRALNDRRIINAKPGSHAPRRKKSDAH